MKVKGEGKIIYNLPLSFRLEYVGGWGCLENNSFENEKFYFRHVKFNMHVWQVEIPS